MKTKTLLLAALWSFMLSSAFAQTADTICRAGAIVTETVLPATS